jgi:hypothetical protein
MDPTGKSGARESDNYFMSKTAVKGGMSGEIKRCEQGDVCYDLHPTIWKRTLL